MSDHAGDVGAERDAPDMITPDYEHNTDSELLERLRSAIEAMHSSFDHEERHRIWHQEARPLADELERRFPPVATPPS